MIQKTIMIQGKPFVYNDELSDIQYDKMEAITEEQARKLLLKTKELFDEVGLEFYLNVGTLLGAVRDHGLIKGDEDVDVFIDDEDKLFNNLPFFQDNGLYLCRMVRKRLYSFRVGGNSFIDVYILGPLGFSIWTPWCYRLCTCVTPKRFFKEYQDIDFLGVQCKCVKNPEKILEFWYGKNWRTPVRGHKFYYEVPSAYYWHSFKRYFKSVVKICIGWRYWKHLVREKA